MLTLAEIQCLELAEKGQATFDLRYEGGATADLCMILCDRDFLEEDVNEKYAYLIHYGLTAQGAAALAAYRQHHAGD